MSKDTIHLFNNLSVRGISATGNVSANNFIGTGSGNPTISSATNLDLNPAVAVRIVGGGSLTVANTLSAGNTTIAGITRLSSPNTSATAWTTSGINLVQSATTFTDTTSTGTVAEIRINSFAAQTLAATSTTTVTNLYGNYFTTPVAGTNITATNRWAIATDNILSFGAVVASGAGTFAAAFSMTTIGFNINIGTSQTTGVLTLGGPSQTATMTIGQSTVSQTTNIQAGATASGNTKTINIGTGGLSGSTTNITIGSTFGTSIVLNAPIRLAAYTVATLPAAGVAGRRAYVTNATSPTFLGTLTGGGAVVCPVFDNGTAWVAG